MTVRVDYRCQHCGLVEEVTISSPTATRPCTACGRTAKRRWTAFRIGRGSSTAGPASDREPAAGPGRPGDPGSELCRSNPGVPGLCLLSRSAGRALVARADNDGRSLEREQQRQAEYLDATGRPAAVVSDHGHSHRPDTGAQPGPGPREIV